MKKVDIVVLKNKKGDLMEGDFYVKRLSFDEITKVMEQASDASTINTNIISHCLVHKDGAPVFKPQQRKLIAERLPGVDTSIVMAEAEALNRFARLGQLGDEYEKNSESDQS
jgi:hypothetical protein